MPTVLGCCDGLLDTGSDAGSDARVEPKVFLANERTFLTWLSMSVTLGSIASVRTRARAAAAAAAAGEGVGAIGYALRTPRTEFLPSGPQGAHTHARAAVTARQVLMTFGRKNAEVAEGVSILSDSLLIIAIAFVVWSSMRPRPPTPRVRVSVCVLRERPPVSAAADGTRARGRQHLLLAEAGAAAQAEDGRVRRSVRTHRPRRCAPPGAWRRLHVGARQARLQRLCLGQVCRAPQMSRGRLICGPACRGRLICGPACVHRLTQADTVTGSLARLDKAGWVRGTHAGTRSQCKKAGQAQRNPSCARFGGAPTVPRMDSGRFAETHKGVDFEV